MRVPFPEVEVLLHKYDIEHPHVFHVADLTLQLFDSFQETFELSSRDRELLHAAALLHDIGWSQTPDGKGHHKESMRLIDLFSWVSVDEEEKDLIAQCARYHRKSIPKKEHERFERLSNREKSRVEKMAGLLRIGDALDRTHRQIVRKVEIDLKKAKLQFFIHSSTDPHAEIKMAYEKSNLLQKVLEHELSFNAVFSAE